MSRDAEGAPIRLVQITDCHLYAEPGRAKRGVDTERALDAVLAHVAAREDKVDLVLATGDLAHDGSAQAYRRLRAKLEALGAPVRCLPGNHDDPACMAAELDGGALRYMGTAALGPWRAVLLDSVIPGEDGGRLAAAELARLDGELEAHGDRHVMIVLHHPPLPTGSAGMDAIGLAEPEALLARADAHPCVRALLWGHVHQAFDAARGHVHLMATPSTCFQFAPGSDSIATDDAPPGYRRIRLWPDGRLETEVIRVPGARAASAAAAR